MMESTKQLSKFMNSGKEISKSKKVLMDYNFMLREESKRPPLTILLEAIKIQEEKFHPLNINLRYTLHALGNAFAKEKENEKAVEAWTKAFKIGIQRACDDLLIYCANSLGEHYLNLKNLEKVNELYNQAMPIIEKSGIEMAKDIPKDITRKIAIFYNNVGGIQMRLKDPKKALESFNTALKLAEYSKDSELLDDLKKKGN